MHVPISAGALLVVASVLPRAVFAQSGSTTTEQVFTIQTSVPGDGPSNAPTPTTFIGTQPVVFDSTFVNSGSTGEMSAFPMPSVTDSVLTNPVRTSGSSPTTTSGTAAAPESTGEATSLRGSTALTVFGVMLGFAWTLV